MLHRTFIPYKNSGLTTETKKIKLENSNLSHPEGLKCRQKNIQCLIIALSVVPWHIVG